MNTVIASLKKIIRCIVESGSKTSMKPKTFRPSPLAGTTSPFVLATMSMAYWDLAYEFNRKALTELHDGGKQYSIYVFPAIIMYCSSVEALVNESLALFEQNLTDQDSLDDLRRLRRALRPYNNIPSKFKRAYELLSHGTAQLDNSVLESYQALNQVRNAIIHYCPEYIDILEWPHNLRQALSLSGVQPIPADWTISFRSPKVLEWADEASKRIIGSFLQVSDLKEDDFFGAT